MTMGTKLAAARGAGLVALSLALGLPDPAAGDEASAGKAVYTARCASCHGATGRGDTKLGERLKVTTLVDARWADEGALPQIEKAVREGVGTMPGFGSKLTPAEVEAVSRYTRELVSAELAKP
jgi:cytochrome c6